MKSISVFLLLLTVIILLPGCMEEKQEDKNTDPTQLLNVGPSFSRDGTFMIFTSDKSGSANLYSYKFDDSKEVELTAFATDEWSGSSIFHPDGNIIYESNSGGLFSPWIMNPSTGATSKLFTDGKSNYRHFCISPDGSNLAYSKKLPTTSYYKIFISKFDGTNEKQVSQGEYNDFKPTWSTTNKLIFYRYIGTQTDLILVDMNQTAAKEVNITNSPYIDEYDPAFSHTSDLFYFVSGSMSGAGSIYRMMPDATSVTQVITGAGNFRDISVSYSDNRLLYTFSENEGDFDIYLASTDGKILKRITRGIDVVNESL